MVSPGDWVLDIGANIGHYTARLSNLVGPSGRVLAFEPIPETFELLSANVAQLPTQNVTLFNAAASEETALVKMVVPVADTGLANNYLAHISDSGQGVGVLCLNIDSLNLPQKIALVKIDAEGHDLNVLKGMVELLRRNQPTLIVEDNSPGVADFLTELGYSREKLPGSCNCIFRQEPVVIATQRDAEAAVQAKALVI
jgi:FkbM family methyltransferase